MLFYTVYKHVYQNNYVSVLRKRLYPSPFCVHSQLIGDTLAHVVSRPTWKHPRQQPRTLFESIGMFLRESREWTTKVLKEGGSVRSQAEPGWGWQESKMCGTLYPLEQLFGFGIRDTVEWENMWQFLIPFIFYLFITAFVTPYLSIIH